MKVLVFDAETTGFPDYRREYSAGVQPHLVELAAELLEVPPNPDEATMIDGLDELLELPHGVKVPDQALAVHGISEFDCLVQGLPPRTVLLRWAALERAADVVVSFNMQFDAFILRTAFFRAKQVLPEDLAEKQIVCAMVSSARVMQLKFPKGGTGKFPNLEEAHEHFLGEPFVRSEHRAIQDVRATRKVFLELVRRGHVQLTGRKPRP